MNVQLSTDADFESIIKSNKKVIVKYFADWCGSCKLFSPKFKRLAADERFTDVVFVEVNAEENDATRQMGGVDNLPFMATFKDGALVEGTATSKEEYVVKMLEDLN
ncbi:MAG: thioredoxin family protein [Bacteroidia bacterium]